MILKLHFVLNFYCNLIVYVLLNVGEEITIMQTRKGTYIRTFDDKIFCVKTNDDSSQNQPLLNVNNNEQQANGSNFLPNVATQNEAVSETTDTSFQFTLPSAIGHQRFSTESKNCEVIFS